MITSNRRSCWAILSFGLLLSLPATAAAQEKTPFPTLSDKHVYVSGVPDRYQTLEAQINQLERSSPQTYYVVVVKWTGPGDDATTRYAKELFEHWQSQASGGRRSFKPDRTVLIVLAIDKQQVAVHAGGLLRSRYGLNKTRIEHDLIDDLFIKRYAIDSKFPEGLSALLNATNDTIADHDHETARAPVKFTATSSPQPSGKATATTSPSVLKTPAKTTPKTIQIQTTSEVDAGSQAAALQARKSADWVTGLAVVVPIVAALALLILVALWWGYRRTRSRVGGRIKEIKAKAVDVMDHLDALKERIKLLPTSPEFTQPMTGDTAAVYRSAKDKNDKLWDGWLQVMEVLDKAQKLADRSGSLFSQKTLGEAEKLIEEKGSFAEIERQSQAIAKTIDRLDKAHPAARSVLEAITAGKPKLNAALEALAKLALPETPYQGDLDSLASGTTKAGAAMIADPLGTQSVLEELRGKSESLLARIERVASLFGDATQVKTSLETIKRQVAAHRAQGLSLVENVGNPDAALSQGEGAQTEILEALRAGDPELGAGKLNTAQGFVQEAQTTIERVQKARAFCDREPAARLRETERLRAAMSQAEAYHAELERDFAPTSWSAVSRNGDQAHALLATFDRQVQDAVAAATNRQEYLKSAGLLEELARQQQIVLRLMSGLGEQLNALTAVRDQSRSLIEELAASERETDALIRQNESIVGDGTRSGLAKAQEARQQILLSSARSRPDWAAVRQKLAEAIEELSIARSQAEDDVKNYEQLTSEFEATRRAASRVYALLSSHQEDRLAANQHYQAAAEALDRISVNIREPRGAAAAWLAQVRDAASDLERSEQLAREDIQLAAQAQAEISEGASAIRQAQSYGGFGIGSDIATAHSQLMHAEQLLQSQNYEQSIQVAGAATQSARQVYYAAMQRAMFEQMAAQAEQRRRAARMAAPSMDGISFGAAAATAAAATILDLASSEPPEPGSTTSEEPEPATAGGSWGGETAGGSW